MTGVVRIGTSGWHYKHWLGLFYPPKLAPKEMFRFYSLHFDTVELNNTFYRLPKPETFESWRDNSPNDFLYAVKASRFITHMKKLKDPRSSTVKFFHGAERLGRKLGPILFQLPPHWRVDTQRLSDFLAELPEEHRYVIEIRDETWLVEDVYELLRQFNVAFCIHDLAHMQTALEITADFTYIRFHGPGAARYRGSYSDSALREWAERIAEWRDASVDSYVYFNNDIGGHAIRNAQTLKQLLGV
ncbi:MAG TPA: DUF72 domain-containing protein [Pyrinomonadaceae bacterium]|nr:DUF72 domain-containing protein [Pyrinomonadaceae bacterium]